MRSPLRKSPLFARVALAVAVAVGITGGGVPLLSSIAEAAPKKKKPAKPAPKPAEGDKDKGVEEGEIEMGGDEGAAPAGGDAKPAGGDAKPAGGEAKGGVEEGEIEMGGDEQPAPSLEADTATTSQADDAAAVKAQTALKSTTRLSWQDIVVVIRKPFLKVRRAELLPFVATTMNDNIIRHYSIGGQFNYYLTDVLAIGLEGQYFQDQFREPFDLVARQARRLPTVNKYNFAGSLLFHYVPVYGKFAILDKHLVTWEAFLTAGIGATQSEVIPRDTKFPGFTNLLITPTAGASMRFFLFKWLTVTVGARDYLYNDHFEPRNREMYPTAEQAKDHPDKSFVNNVMFQIGVSFWLPTSFEYTTFR
jgi:outer membrane beta-barrel protein